MKAFLPFLIGAAATCAANAQNSPSLPKFEVASVKRTEHCFNGNSSLDPGSVTFKGLPLKGVLMEAFKVSMQEIEGPSWLETECFDISAKIPNGASRDQVPAMLQALLAERFKLAAHKEDRPRTGYALVVDKGGLKFKEDDSKGSLMGKYAKPGLTFYGFGGGRLKGVMTMGTLASNLSKEGYGPVQDATGIAGKYEIDLTWTRDKAAGLSPGDAAAVADMPAPETSLFSALRDSGGLKLERRSVQVQYVVIDHVERVPTEN